MFSVVWSDYFRYRAQLRGFDLVIIENILRYSNERYYDTETDRVVAVGKHSNQLVLIPYELTEDACIPITIHAITRQQIRFRLKTRRFIINE